MQNSKIKERLEALRSLMQKEQIDYYMIPTGDYHQSEYIGDYFKEREYMSGFTGSAGTLLISKDMAGLWTDGRYFVQAEHELAGTSIELFRMQEEGVPSLTGYLAAHVWDGAVIGFDGRVVSASFKDRLLQEMSHIVRIESGVDLVDQIWKDRPWKSAEKIYYLEDSIAGKNTKEKLKDLRIQMKKFDGEAVLFSALDAIMWLYNLRGNDVQCSPVALSYAYVTQEEAFLFAEPEAVTEEIGRYLASHQITVKPYAEIYSFLKQQGGHEKIKLLLDEGEVSLTLYETEEERHEIAHCPNFMLIPKAVKNETEIELCKKYHLSDAVAVTKFIYWLKMQADLTQETELSVTEKLESFRRQQKGYMEPSFETIAAYGKNAAMIHYTADEKTDTPLEKRGMLLVDSGGQYLGATTDITRTIVLGELDYEQKKQYTAVLCGMLKLANAQFLHGCTGRNLDILAREPLWKLGLDYRHGTGHGVGSFLSVHEGPQAFRYKQSESLPEAVLEPGMIITDEPGIYIEESHGIRIENELLCVERISNEWGRYLGFEILTHVPIDLDAVLPECMSEECKEMLNVYHGEVYDMLCPYLEDNERKWLISQTKQI